MAQRGRIRCQGIRCQGLGASAWLVLCLFAVAPQARGVPYYLGIGEPCAQNAPPGVPDGSQSLCDSLDTEASAEASSGARASGGPSGSGGDAGIPLESMSELFDFALAELRQHLSVSLLDSLSRDHLLLMILSRPVGGAFVPVAAWILGLAEGSSAPDLAELPWWELGTGYAIGLQDRPWIYRLYASPWAGASATLYKSAMAAVYLIPEPATLPLAMAGLGCLVLATRRRAR